MKRLILSIFAAGAVVFAACADLVGLYTFDRTNPLEAVIGSPAKEGVTSGNNQQPVLSDKTVEHIAFRRDFSIERRRAKRCCGRKERNE